MDAIEKQLRRDAMQIAKAAIAAADAGAAVSRNLHVIGGYLHAGGTIYKLSDFDRVFLLAVGKAAGTMALAIEEILRDRLTSGLVITKHGHGVRGLKHCRLRTCGHPIPDSRGLSAAFEAERLLRELNRRDLLLVAISGGASALFPSPVDGVTFEAKQKTTSLLLRAGADIHQLNTVRKHLSRLKGGRVAALAYPATVVGLLLSDVIGDPLDVIGSGVTAPDPSTYADAVEILKKFHLQLAVPAAVRRHLESGIRGIIAETPKPSDPIFKNVNNLLVGSNRKSLEAAALQARKLGYNSAILSSSISGEAREAAKILVEILREAKTNDSPVSSPACLLAGGETVVTVRGKGRGGRNQEFALSAAQALAGVGGVLVMSVGTDGTDGPTDAAGALATGSTMDRGEKLKLNAEQHLARNDSYSYFRRLGDLVKTGPTGTNVMDVCLLMTAKK